MKIKVLNKEANESRVRNPTYTNKCVDKINEIIDVLNAQNVDTTKDNERVVNITDEVTVELTDEVTVELTEHGKSIVRRYYQNIPFLLVLRHVRNNIYKFLLWELMNIFGKHAYRGADLVFEHNRIVIAENESAKTDAIADAIKNMGWDVEDLKAAERILKGIGKEIGGKRK